MNFAGATVRQNRADCPAMVNTYSQSRIYAYVAVYRQRFGGKRVVNHERDQLFREADVPIIIPSSSSSMSASHRYDGAHTR
jgi:hypothetical protein